MAFCRQVADQLVHSIIGRSLERLDTAIRELNPSHVFALFSGGHDSLAATYIASKHPRFSAAVHINTGIGIEKTRQFVHDTCEAQEWELLEYKAVDNVNAKGEPDPQVYEDMVLEYGFPGPTKFGHNKMYNRLKERQIRRLIREHKQHRFDKIILVTGCRSQESKRRMGHVKEVQVDHSRVWTAIIHDWSKFDVEQFIRRVGLPRNLVVELLSKSGECLCGAFAKKGELAELQAFFPEDAAKIRELERRVKRRFPWGWEEGPPAGWRKYGSQCKDEMRGNSIPLCMSCEKRDDDEALND